MYNSRERVLQFAAEVIPMHYGPHLVIAAREGEILQTTEWESENGNERWAIQGLIRHVDRDTFDKGLNDRIFDKEFVKLFTVFSTREIKSREEVFATGEKERGGHPGAFFEQTFTIIAIVTGNCLDNIVNDVLRNCHHRAKR